MIQCEFTELYPKRMYPKGNSMIKKGDQLTWLAPVFDSHRVFLPFFRSIRVLMMSYRKYQEFLRRNHTSES